MTTLFDEIEGSRTRQAIALGMCVLALLALACVKVRNELMMTKAYDRQAAALERIADALESRSDQVVERPAGKTPCAKEPMTLVYYRDKDMGPHPIGVKVARVQANTATLKAWGAKNPAAQIMDVRYGEACK